MTNATQHGKTLSSDTRYRAIIGYREVPSNTTRHTTERRISPLPEVSSGINATRESREHRKLKGGETDSSSEQFIEFAIVRMQLVQWFTIFVCEPSI